MRRLRATSTMLVVLGHGYDGLLTCRADQDGESHLLRRRSRRAARGRCGLV